MVITYRIYFPRPFCLVKDVPLWSRRPDLLQTSRTLLYFQPPVNLTWLCQSSKKRSGIYDQIDGLLKKQKANRSKKSPQFPTNCFDVLEQDFKRVFMTKTLHSNSLHTGPGDPWLDVLVVFLGCSLRWWKDGSLQGHSGASMLRARLWWMMTAVL